MSFVLETLTHRHWGTLDNLRSKACRVFTWDLCTILSSEPQLLSTGPSWRNRLLSDAALQIKPLNVLDRVHDNTDGSFFIFGLEVNACVARELEKCLRGTMSMACFCVVHGLDSDDHHLARLQAKKSSSGDRLEFEKTTFVFWNDLDDKAWKLTLNMLLLTQRCASNRKA